MSIKKIKISNFKSFKDVEVELGNFNVFIGANASGKTNFIQIFRFLRDLAIHGLENAISLQGGIDYLRNINLKDKNEFSLEVVLDDKGLLQVVSALWDLLEREEKKEKKELKIKVYETIYKIVIKFTGEKQNFKPIENKVIQKFYVFKSESKEKIDEGEIIFSIDRGRLKIEDIKLENLPVREKLLKIVKSLYALSKFLKLLEFLVPELESDVSFRKNMVFVSPNPDNFFKNILICDFDPKLSKRAIAMTGKVELEEDGSNLAIVLKNIISNKDDKERLSKLVNYVLPYVEDFDIEKLADKSIILKLKEKYNKSIDLPSYLISEGTINIIGLIVALFFDKRNIVIIEEPERNIHPHLISKIVDIMKDVATNPTEKKQIIITTHNPEIVKHAGLENLFLVSRDKEGFSVVSKPKDKLSVKIFLEKFGVDELYIDNLLEAPI
jgi:predicted ATPase